MKRWGFYSDTNILHFHKSGIALSLILKVRVWKGEMVYLRTFGWVTLRWRTHLDMYTSFVYTPYSQITRRYFASCIAFFELCRSEAKILASTIISLPKDRYNEYNSLKKIIGASTHYGPQQTTKIFHLLREETLTNFSVGLPVSQ